MSSLLFPSKFISGIRGCIVGPDALPLLTRHGELRGPDGKPLLGQFKEILGAGMSQKI